MLHVLSGIHVIIMCFQKENIVLILAYVFTFFFTLIIVRLTQHLECTKSDQKHPGFSHLWSKNLLHKYKTPSKESSR